MYVWVGVNVCACACVLAFKRLCVGMCVRARVCACVSMCAYVYFEASKKSSTTLFIHCIELNFDF